LWHACAVVDANVKLRTSNGKLVRPLTIWNFSPFEVCVDLGPWAEPPLVAALPRIDAAGKMANNAPAVTFDKSLLISPHAPI
jgi:hypothetical protein